VEFFLAGSRFATRINLRKAEFTERSSGKCSATSGERSTRLVPALYRAAYFPRTPLFNFRRSYSVRRSSRCFRNSVFLFIFRSLETRCFPGADNSDSLSSVSMGHKQKPASARLSKSDVTLFLEGMVRVIVGIETTEQQTPWPLRGTKPHVSGDFAPLWPGPIQSSRFHITSTLQLERLSELEAIMIITLGVTRGIYPDSFPRKSPSKDLFFPEPIQGVQ